MKSIRNQRRQNDRTLIDKILNNPSKQGQMVWLGTDCYFIFNSQIFSDSPQGRYSLENGFSEPVIKKHFRLLKDLELDQDIVRQTFESFRMAGPQKNYW